MTYISTLSQRSRALQQVTLVITLSLIMTGCASSDRYPSIPLWGKVTKRENPSSTKNYGASLNLPADEPGEEDTDYLYKDRPKSEANANVAANPIILPDYEIDANENVSFNFRNADIRVVVKAILSDLLQKAYTIDPEVNGSLSLQSNGSISRETILQILEITLAAKGIALINDANLIKIIPLDRAPGHYATNVSEFAQRDTKQAGYSIQVVGPRYLTPSQLKDVLAPFAPEKGVLYLDDDINLLILSGTQQEMRAMQQVIKTFDVDRFEDMSISLFRLKHGKATDIVDEITDIISKNSILRLQKVKFLPIQRLNMIVISSKDPVILAEIQRWIRKLDLPSPLNNRRVYIYHTKNSRALDLANLLNTVFKNKIYLSDNTITSPSQESPAENLSRNDMLGASSEEVPPIVASTNNNSILVYASAQEYAVIENALSRMDRPSKQVFIEATLAEVTLTDELRYGVQWSVQKSDFSATLGADSSALTSERSVPIFSFVFQGSQSVKAMLSALEKVTDVNVLFAPKLMVIDNQTASLQVGDKVPVLTQSAVSSQGSGAPIVNTIAFKDTGVILSVTPHIGRDGLILIDIEQEVSGVIPTSSSQIDAPTIQTRKIKTSISVQSGDTIALGGMIREAGSRGSSGIPILNRIPLIGGLFGQKEKTKNRTELVIMLTPRIAENYNDTVEIMNDIQATFSSIAPLYK
mgnify:CR=1 FL=1